MWKFLFSRKVQGPSTSIPRDDKYADLAKDILVERLRTLGLDASDRPVIGCHLIMRGYNIFLDPDLSLEASKPLIETQGIEIADRIHRHAMARSVRVMSVNTKAYFLKDGRMCIHNSVYCF